jgi:hypothetical protein
MSIKKTLAAVAAGSLLAGFAAVAVAGPAAAVDQGPVLPGAIYWFNATGNLDTLTAAQQIHSGARTPADATNPKPWLTLALENACPAGSVQVQATIRIPQVGVPENDWEEVAITDQPITKDSQGRFYINAADRMSKPQILQYNIDHPSATGNQFPYLVNCHDATDLALGSFKTTLTVVGTTTADYSWSIPLAALPQAASTTTLSASASSVEVGSPVSLTAAVAPSSATGAVEFFSGATSLGTAPVASGSAVLTTSALPVGSHSITAVYSGSSASSTSAPVVVDVTAVPARQTTTVLAVSPVSGASYQNVTLSTTVTATAGAPSGTVTLKDGALTLGSVLCTNGVVADFTTNGLGAGTHSLAAVFVGTAPYESSTSTPVAATYTPVGVSDEQTVVVTIPVGTLTITTPYTPASPLDLSTAVLDTATSTYSASAPFNDIVINDTRSGQLGFTASVVAGAFTGGAGGTDAFSGSYAGLTGLAATQVVGNALLATNVDLTNHAPATDGLDVPKVFAVYGAHQALGTAKIAGTFGIAQVPSSVTPGSYTSTVTFTAV